MAVPDKLVERGPEGEAGDAEVARQLPLGRDRVPDLERLDEVQDLVAGVFLLAHGLVVLPSPAGHGRQLNTFKPSGQYHFWGALGCGAASVRSVTCYIA